MSELDAAAWGEIRRLYETSDLSVREIALRFKTTLTRIYARREAEGWPKRSETTPEALAAVEARYARGVAAARAREAEPSRRAVLAHGVANGAAPAGAGDSPDEAVTPDGTQRAAEVDDLPGASGEGRDCGHPGGVAPAATPAASATRARASRRTAGRRNGAGARYGRPVGPRPMGREALLSRMVRLAERNLAIMEKHMESEDGHTTPEERERSTRTVGALIKTIEKATEMSPGNDDAPVTADIKREATAELRRELAERIFRMWGGPKR